MERSALCFQYSSCKPIHFGSSTPGHFSYQNFRNRNCPWKSVQTGKNWGLRWFCWIGWQAPHSLSLMQKWLLCLLMQV
jgi:hypothetical protein